VIEYPHEDEFLPFSPPKAELPLPGPAPAPIVVVPGDVPAVIVPGESPIKPEYPPLVPIVQSPDLTALEAKLNTIAELVAGLVLEKGEKGDQGIPGVADVSGVAHVVLSELKHDNAFLAKVAGMVKVDPASITLRSGPLDDQNAWEGRPDSQGIIHLPPWTDKLIDEMTGQETTQDVYLGYGRRQRDLVPE
jgi:hypothetical protein